jgi:hypothetical protein
VLRSSEQAGVLVLHFDTAEHTISLETFVDTAASVRYMSAVLARQLFGPTVDVKIYVLPPEEGSFLSSLKTIIVGGSVVVASVVGTVAAGVTILQSDYVRSYFEARTGMSMSEMGAEHGRADREKAEAAEAEELLTVVVESLLAGSPENLEEICKLLPVEVIEARSDFYLACHADREVKGIGFSSEEDFPIRRPSFLSYSQAGAAAEEDAPEWQVSIDYVEVSSPQWDLHDQKSRQWKGRNSSNKTCHFVIEDEQFWKRVHDRDLKAEVLDRLQVQWAYRAIKNRVTERRVLRVLNFNNVQLAEPLDADALEAILGRYRRRDQPSHQFEIKW